MHTLATGAWPYLAALTAFPCAAAQRWQPSKHMTPTGVCLPNTSVQEGTMHCSPVAAGLWDALCRVPVAGPSCRAQLDGL